MHIKKLNIENFRGIRKMELELHPKMNVFIGVNGVGKSSVLDALAMNFSRSPIFSDGHALPVSPSDINQEADKIFIGLYCEALGSEYIVNMEYSDRRQSSETDTTALTISENEEMADASGEAYYDLGVCRKEILDGDRTLNYPIVVCYPSNRAVRGNGNSAGFRSVSLPLDALDGALSSSPDFRPFLARYTEGIRSIKKHADERPGADAYIDFFMKWHAAQLKAIRVAIRHITSDGYNLSAKPESYEMVINKDARSFEILQLSDGEKCLIALVGDLALRLAIANPSLDDPLHGEGIVLIDEIDLHLHPTWQRTILPRLMETFPKCQFIVTTHSPQILGELEKSDGKIIPLQDKGNGIEDQPGDFNVFGQTSDVILVDVMEASKRNEEITEMLDEIFKAIDANNLDETRRLKSELEKKAQNIPEFAKIELLLHRKEKLGK